MPINFPGSPTNGQTFTYSGRTWTFTTGKGWSAGGSYSGGGGGGSGGGITESDTAPSSPVSGDRWYDTSTGIFYTFIDDGDSTQWVAEAIPGAAGPATSFEMTFTPPTTSTFSLVRVDTGSHVNLSGGRGTRLIYPVPTGSPDNVQYAMVAISSGAGGWEAIARIRRHAPLVIYGATGIAILDNSSGKIQSLDLAVGTALGISRNNWTNATTFSSTPVNFPYCDLELWMKVKEASGVRSWYISKDGDFWQRVYYETISGNFLASPTHVGYSQSANIAPGGTAYQGADSAFDCLSWAQNALP